MSFFCSWAFTGSHEIKTLSITFEDFHVISPSVSPHMPLPSASDHPSFTDPQSPSPECPSPCGKILPSLWNPGQTSPSLVPSPCQFCWSSELEHHLAHLPVMGSIESYYNHLGLYPSACWWVPMQGRGLIHVYIPSPSMSLPAWKMQRKVLAAVWKVSITTNEGEAPELPNCAWKERGSKPFHIEMLRVFPGSCREVGGCTEGEPLGVPKAARPTPNCGAVPSSDS